MKLFWLLLTGTCMVWYSTVTIYVAIRGASDIKGMLSRLAGQTDAVDAADDAHA